MRQPRVEVVLADEHASDVLRAALQRVQASVSFRSLSQAPSHEPAAADALVVVLPRVVKPWLGALRYLMLRLAVHPRPVLLVGSATASGTGGAGVSPGSASGEHGGGSLELAVPHPPTVPVLTTSGADPTDLATKLSLMLELSSTLEALHRDMQARSRFSLHAARRFANQLRVASRVQRKFLPESLPRFGRFSFEVLFRPLDYVSGDIYDVRRLDDEHVGIALADASGHGIPAALLTVYVKRALRGKEPSNGEYRVLPPDEVLRRLNEDLLEAHLGECPFVAAVYGVLNVKTQVLSLARAGAPYPLLRRADGELQTLVTRGVVVGVSPDANFEVRDVKLEPGDSVLLYSDGLERIATVSWGGAQVAAADYETAPPPEADADCYPIEPLTGALARCEAAESIAACHVAAAAGPSRILGVAGKTPAPPVVAEATEARPTLAMGVAAHGLGPQCYQTLRVNGARAVLEQTAHRHRALRRMGFPLDDLTVLAVCVDE